ncbi:hypothetical protein GCM10022409_13030 [Hymenobacter glaciei]|uniref:Tetratricopeptide repeat protein n=1 Tax=Hymenobacter glaciei TaxID=877209 RepID=A0ABP7TRD5_9BACT
MEYSLPAELIPAFDAHFEKGHQLLQSVIILHGASVRKPGFWAKRKGRQAITEFQKCLKLVPHHWPTLWLLGKAYQGLGEHSTALRCFVQAYDQQPNSADVVREASIAAMDSGQPVVAAEYSAIALALAPHDAGLLCNHAVNLLVAGKDHAALEFIQQAVNLAPEDPINQHAYKLIQEVTSGTSKRPTWQEIN